jgi:hypothetical protein
MSVNISFLLLTQGPERRRDSGVQLRVLGAEAPHLGPVHGHELTAWDEGSKHAIHVVLLSDTEQAPLCSPSVSAVPTPHPGHHNRRDSNASRKTAQVCCVEIIDDDYDYSINCQHSYSQNSLIQST